MKIIEKIINKLQKIDVNVNASFPKFGVSDMKDCLKHIDKYITICYKLTESRRSLAEQEQQLFRQKRRILDTKKKLNKNKKRGE